MCLYFISHNNKVVQRALGSYFAAVCVQHWATTASSFLIQYRLYKFPSKSQNKEEIGKAPQNKHKDYRIFFTIFHYNNEEACLTAPQSSRPSPPKFAPQSSQPSPPKFVRQSSIALWNKPCDWPNIHTMHADGLTEFYINLGDEGQNGIDVYITWVTGARME